MNLRSLGMNEEKARQLSMLIDEGTLDKWANFINEWGEEKGWNDERKSEGDWAALVHSEISEAFEEHRNNKPAIYFSDERKPEGIVIEYADALIRILHWFAAHNKSVEEALRLKMAYNYDRPHKHGGKRL